MVHLSSHSRSTNWYHSFIDNLPVAIIRTTFEGRVVLCNKLAIELFGFDSKEELVGSSIIDLYQDKRNRGIYIQKILEKGFLKDSIIGFIRKNGTPIWCSSTSRVIQDTDGTIEFIDAVFRDITSELGPQSQTIQLNELDNQIVNFVLHCDSNGNIINVLSENDILYGYCRDELRHNIDEIFTQRYKGYFKLITDQIDQRGKDKGLFSIFDTEKNVRHVEYYAKKSDQNGISFYEIIARDITETLLLHKSKVDRQKFQGILELAGGVSHQINQPLTIINNLINDIQNEVDRDHVAYPKIIFLQEQVKSLNAIVKKVGNIKKYASMDYVGGLKIVDIDRAS